jgi:DNA-binding NtrC family response regulator
MKRILIATCNRESADSIGRCFSKDGNQVSFVTDSEACKHAVASQSHDFFFIDLALMASPEERVSEIKQRLRAFQPTARDSHLIVLVQPERIRQAVAVVKAVASDYLTIPINISEVKLVMANLNESDIMEFELEYLRDRFWKSDSLEIIRTKSPAMLKVLNQVKSAAPTQTTVIITGESGTGKGVIAKLIHRHSVRKDHQFISLHCGAIPETLLESELFGHERGAFTGANKRKLGKLDIAQQGTIFLDEIGTISLSAQIKLLQVLQEKVYNRIGGEHSIAADVRVIAATNANLREMVDSGTFRQDLFYRLNVFPIEIPPLRERAEDIPLLLGTFLDNLNNLHGKEIEGIDESVMEAMVKYPWPGNIRELENVMERAYILETSREITAENLPGEIVEYANDSVTSLLVDCSVSLSEFRQKGVEELERKYLEKVLENNSGKINRSAEQAGVSVRQIHKLLGKYGIRKELFKKT